MTATVNPIPQGMHTITPHLVCKDAAAAIEFYKEAFGAVEVDRLAGPGGKLMHAMLRIGDSSLMLVDEFPEMQVRAPQSIGGSSVTIHLAVVDADAAFKRATDASTLSETYCNYASFLAGAGRSEEARAWAERILAKKATMPNYLRRRERPWFRKAKAVLNSLPQK